MTKAYLRKYYLHRRQQLSEAVSAAYNLRLYNHFFLSVDLSFLKVIHTYLPMAERNEPDTWMIIDRIRREFPHLKISLPKVTGNELQHFYFEGLHQISEGPWGLREPSSGIPTPVEAIDLVLVPLAIFDRQGHRVGYGKGFYDRFLRLCRPDCRKIGLSFFDGVDQIEDVQPHDTTLTACITPDGLVNF